MTSTLMAAHDQWATRPDDERFVNLHDLHTEMTLGKTYGTERRANPSKLFFAPDETNPRTGLTVAGERGTKATLTNHAFTQLAQIAGAPAKYMQSLPANLAADCLNHGVTKYGNTGDSGLLFCQTEQAPLPTLRAATGPDYGRVWNSDVTAELIRMFGDGVSGDFRVPGEFGQGVEVTKSNTTIYGSDRDMFVFLADEQNRVEVPDRRDGKHGEMARGFFLWNSEVGKCSLGVGFFLFDFVCSNRMVWGAQDYTEVRLRHSLNASDRWGDVIEHTMEGFQKSDPNEIVRQVTKAKDVTLDSAGGITRMDKIFGRRTFVDMQMAHEEEEGRPMETVWDVVTGATALAKGVTTTDTRLVLERKAGDLMSGVAADFA